ncbi:MAG TPA: MFS transporter [Fibrobacteria bacterium]|nr:MFS transporter [Fibrobacteria bacterium]
MLINAFVGGMVGLERTVVPLIGTREFHLVLNTTATSFIISFGLSKASMNLWSGAMADRYGRKRILVLGWLVGLPVPFLIIHAPSWGWIVAANILLGVNQGLAWSMAVVMKIDLAGPKSRGLAVGLNEFTGYLALGLTAWATGYLAARYGLRPYPFFLGIGYAALGLGLSAILVRETLPWARLGTTGSTGPRHQGFWNIFARTSWLDRSLFSASQAGLINNLNDGMSWGLLPLFFASKGLDVECIGTLKFVYPAVWGVAQLGTGPLSDKVGRRPLIQWGMILQAVAIWLMVAVETYHAWIGASVLLGLGTAMVYPALLAEVSDRAPASQRATSLGIYRFWRDSGYAVGALLSGLLADAFGFAWAIILVGSITFLSGVQVAFGMRENGHHCP